MKKIYSISVFLVTSLLLSIQGLGQAGPQCPVPATVFYFDQTVGPGGSCGVFITGAPIGTTIKVYDDTDRELTLPGAPVINPGGGGAALIPCGAIPRYVTFSNSGGVVVCFTYVDENTVTPIKLSTFSASLKGSSSVVLSWTSDQEFNSALFSVEKSGDGKNFTTTGSVKAAGTSYTKLKYSFTDNSFAGTAYYRLKMIDIDGTSEYSKIVYVNGGSGSTNGVLSVFPNPFRSDVQLKGINASDVNRNNIRVFSAAGKEVSFRVSGSNSISIDPAVPSGVYILRVAGQSYKLFKEQK